jgi:hypothetical protein
MPFEEALKLLRSGSRVQRDAWAETRVIFFVEDHELTRVGAGGHDRSIIGTAVRGVEVSRGSQRVYTLSPADLNATDWSVAE